MPGENGEVTTSGRPLETIPLQDRSEPEDESPQPTKAERGRQLDQERKLVRERRLAEQDAELKRTGQVVDVKAAMLRCFTAGTSEPERLVNDERPS